MCYEQNYRNKLILKNKVYHVIVVLRFFFSDRYVKVLFIA